MLWQWRLFAQLNGFAMLNRYELITSVNFVSFSLNLSAIKSGDYYMFDEPDLEVIDFNEKTRRPQIPDPVGDELDRIANLHGVTAVS